MQSGKCFPAQGGTMGMMGYSGLKKIYCPGSLKYSKDGCLWSLPVWTVLSDGRTVPICSAVVSPHWIEPMHLWGNDERGHTFYCGGLFPFSHQKLLVLCGNYPCEVVEASTMGTHLLNTHLTSSYSPLTSTSCSIAHWMFLLWYGETLPPLTSYLSWISVKYFICVRFCCLSEVFSLFTHLIS